MLKLANFINGENVAPEDGAYLDHVNPAIGTVDSQVPDSNSKDVEKAVFAAENAFVIWSSTPVEERSRVLSKIADLIDSRKMELAKAESEDQGKPVTLAFNMDIARASWNFRFFATEILHRTQDSTDMDGAALNYVIKKPVGVVGLISPWNLPLYLLTWKIAPAIAAGCTVVAKPSEFTSRTAYMLGDILNQAGLPKGVVNIVLGLGPKVGEALVKHPRVRAISFTGGTMTGERIMREAAAQTKKLSLELGGKNPNIIFADSDLDAAIDTTIRSSFLNQGEICLCGSRIFVEQSIYPQFVERLVAKAKALKVGDPSQETTFMGPLVNEGHFKKVVSYIEDAKSAGAKILCGGKKTDLNPPFDKGFFVDPTVIVEAKRDSKIQQDEVFGPVVTVTPFSTEDEALQLANDTKYGLSASLWTQNLSRAHRFARKLNVGTVWINTWLMRDLRVPFGGAKASGIGREGGNHSLDFFSETTTVCIKL
ncbi:MAG: aldehyde dehydrogenase [Pseudobdellovibrionaceae bacterium]